MIFSKKPLNGPNGESGVWCRDNAIVAVSEHFFNGPLPDISKIKTPQKVDIGDTYFLPVPVFQKVASLAK
jgi:hypothetical protein